MSHLLKEKCRLTCHTQLSYSANSHGNGVALLREAVMIKKNSVSARTILPKVQRMRSGDTSQSLWEDVPGIRTVRWIQLRLRIETCEDEEPTKERIPFAFLPIASKNSPTKQVTGLQGRFKKCYGIVTIAAGEWKCDADVARIYVYRASQKLYKKVIG